MKVREVRIRNFRNIPDLSFQPETHLNFFIGSNGQGKTSILEALGYLSTLRSFRSAKNDEVVRHSSPKASPDVEGIPSDGAEVSCRLEEADWKTELKVQFIHQGKKTAKIAFIDGKPFRSSAQYLSSRFGQVTLGFHSIVFNPSDHDLVRGEPALRRQYVDRVLSAEDPGYLGILSRYQKTLEQRNALLKEPQRPRADVLEGFTAPLVEAGAWIALKRIEWIRRMKNRLNEKLRQISATQPMLDVFWISNWIAEIDGITRNPERLAPVHFALQSPTPDLEFLRICFRKRLLEEAEASYRAGVTLVGPHRDDFVLTLGEQVLKGHGSQGEVRSALLALKLSEIDLFRESTGHRPILLLDDFSSELDRERRGFLLKYLSETDLQVFVTSTEEPLASVPGAKWFQVSEGRISELMNSGFA